MVGVNSPLREVQDVRMGIWHTHKDESPFTATINGLERFWSAWCTLLAKYEASFNTAVAEEVRICICVLPPSPPIP